MRQGSVGERSQIPGVGDVPGLGALFGNKKQLTQKRELVILLKPTIIQGGATWTQDLMNIQQRMNEYNPASLTER